MRLLVVNPNTTAAVTERIRIAAARAAAPGTEVAAASAASGIPLIRTDAESARAGAAVVDLLRERAGGFDAAVIAAYSDPGLDAARAACARPVVGIAEASMLDAADGGRRFAIVTPAIRLGDTLRAMAARYGVADRLAAVRIVPGYFEELAADPDGYARQLVDLCLAAVAEDAVGAVVLGGGPLAGLAEIIAPAVPVPVLDGVSCAVRRAERLATGAR